MKMVNKKQQKEVQIEMWPPGPVAGKRKASNVSLSTAKGGCGADSRGARSGHY